MKSFIAMVLSLALIMVGCGASSQDKSEDTEQGSTQESKSAAMQISKEEILSGADVGIVEQDCAVLPMKGHKEINAKFDGEKDYLCSQYVIADGMMFYFIEEADNKGLRQFSMWIDGKNLTQGNQLLFKKLLVVLPKVMEPKEYEALQKALDMTSCKDDAQFALSAKSAQADYSFSKENSVYIWNAVASANESIGLELMDFSQAKTILPYNRSTAKGY